LLHLEHSFVCCWKLDTSEVRSETPCSIWNVVLEKDGEKNSDGQCEKLKTCYKETKNERKKKGQLDWSHLPYKLLS